jgi:hypothetical protein
VPFRMAEAAPADRQCRAHGARMTRATGIARASGAVVDGVTRPRRALLRASLDQAVFTESKTRLEKPTLYNRGQSKTFAQVTTTLRDLSLGPPRISAWVPPGPQRRRHSMAAGKKGWT